MSLGCRQILSLKSEVFCSLLLSSDVCEVGNQTEVPLEDCTLAEANIFLRYIYMRDPVTDEYQAEGLTKVILTYRCSTCAIVLIRDAASWWLSCQPSSRGCSKRGGVCSLWQAAEPVSLHAHLT